MHESGTGTKRTSQDVRAMSAVAGKPDVSGGTAVAQEDQRLLRGPLDT
jgi:hypothetical protein